MTHVVTEVAGQEPVVRVDIRFRADHAQSEAASLGIDMGDAVHQLHESTRQCLGPTRQHVGEPGEGGPEARHEIALPQRRDLSVVVCLARAHGHELFPVRGADARSRLVVDLRAHDALARVERLDGEETRTSFVHGEQRPSVHRRLEREVEEPRVSLTEETLDADVVTDDLARLWKAVVEGHYRVQQAIHGVAERVTVDSQPARQEQVGLARLHGDARRDRAAGQVPGAGAHIVLCDDPSAGHRVRLALDGEDAIHEHERLGGQAHPGRVLVDEGESVPQHSADRPGGELQARLAVEEGRGSRGRRGGHRGPLRPHQLFCQLEL